MDRENLYIYIILGILFLGALTAVYFNMKHNWDVEYKAEYCKQRGYNVELRDESNLIFAYCTKINDTGVFVVHCKGKDCYEAGR